MCKSASGCICFEENNNIDDMCEKCQDIYLNVNYGVDVADELPIVDYYDALLLDDEYVRTIDEVVYDED